MRGSISALLYTSIAHFSNDGNLLIFPVLIDYYRSFDVSFIILGFGAVIYNLVSGFFSIVVGKVADTVNRDAILIFLGILIQGISISIFSLAFVMGSLVNILVISGTALFGLGQSFYHPLGGSVLNNSFSGKPYGTALGINSSTGSVGRSVVPLMFALILPSFGITNSLYTVSLYEIAAALLIFFGLRNFRRTKVSKKEEKVMSVERSSGNFSFIYVLMIVVFVRSLYTMGISTFLPYYLDIVTNKPVLATIIISSAYLSTIAGQMVFGYLIPIWGGKRVITLTGILSIVSIIFFLIDHQLIVLIASLASFAFFVFSGFPILIGYVRELAPQSVSTTANSLVWGVGSTVGGAVGIALFTILYQVEHYGLDRSMWVLVMIGVVSVMMIPLLPKRRISLG